MLNRMTKKQLQEQLKNAGVEFASTASKQELIELAEEKQALVAKPPKEKKKKEEKTPFYDHLKITKVRDIVLNKRPLKRVSLEDGTVKKVPEEEYRQHLNYK